MKTPERFTSRVKESDRVEVISGQSKGHRGRIKKVLPFTNRVIVEGANMIKKITKPTQRNPKRDIISLEAPLHRSNVMLVCPNCKKTTRIAAKIMPNGKKIRACNKCGELLDKA